MSQHPPAYQPVVSQPSAAAPYAGAPRAAEQVSPKSWLATLLLSIFLGELGIDRFYLGKVGTGILKLLTLGGFGVWWLIDVILVIAGAMRD
ncbi:MAG TPA: TM2 domain-containing protein, partial [Microbacterium sp.]|nr:TM2 domain-containing protein [Microbacterium sp.]